MCVPFASSDGGASSVNQCRYDAAADADCRANGCVLPAQVVGPCHKNADCGRGRHAPSRPCASTACTATTRAIRAERLDCKGASPLVRRPGSPTTTCAISAAAACSADQR
jgi:hypothetical protein